MKYAICLHPYIPMRSEASEASEMVSQLIFGDTFRINAEQPRWFHVIRDCDDYEGWIDFKTATIVSEAEYRQYVNDTPNALLLRLPYNPVQRTEDRKSGSAHLSWGSRIFGLEDTGITFRMHGVRFDVPSMTYIAPVSVSSMSRKACGKYLMQQAQMLLNLPYLWGGCSAFGIDCSGFTQTLFRFIGISLPRDASQQIKAGEEVPFEDAQVGDLAFFNHGEGTLADGSVRVTHVGLVADGGQILHCSGHLHFDKLTTEGIISKAGELTHHLVGVRRYF